MEQNNSIPKHMLVGIEFIRNNYKNMNFEQKYQETSDMVPISFLIFLSQLDSYLSLQLIELIVRSGGDINYKAKYNKSYLYDSIFHGNYEISKFLIENGIQVDENEIKSALKACDNGDILLLILGMGININQQIIADVMCNIISAYKSYSDMVIEMRKNIEEKSRCVVFENHVGSLYNQLEMLLSNGFDPNVKGEDSEEFPLDVAIENDLEIIVELLVKNDAIVFPFMKSENDKIKTLLENNIHKENKKEACYIATSIYGSYDAPEVLILRHYRDTILLNSLVGRLFVKIYYKISPILIEKFKNKNRIKLIVKCVLDKIVKVKK